MERVGKPTPQRLWGVKKICQVTLLWLARYNGSVYTFAMSLLTRFVRHMLDLDGLEKFMADYEARLDSYYDED